MTEKNKKPNQQLSNEAATKSGEVKESPQENKTKAKSNKNKTKRQTRQFPKTATLSLFITVLMSIAVGYGLFILNSQGMLTSDFSNAQSQLNARINTLVKDLETTNHALRMETQSRKQTEVEYGSFKTAMESLATKLGRTTGEWRLAEIEYLLTIANHRLVLGDDRITTIALFEAADQRLKALGDPAFLKIRKQIKDELIALKAVDEPDIAGMSFSLGSFASKVEDFPLIDKQRVATATGQIKDQAPDSWKDIPAAVWKDIKSLVVVRRHQQATEPLLPPAEAWFLYQNLRLKLEQAQLVLLRRDTALFRQQLNEVNTWMSTFFNVESPEVINMLKKTAALAKVDLKPATPDVSGSLRELRTLVSERGVKIGKK